MIVGGGEYDTLVSVPFSSISQRCSTVAERDVSRGMLAVYIRV